jgi:hypothetical protein
MSANDPILDSSRPNLSGSTQIPLPNSTPVLVLGILSIVLCLCYGLIGLILGIIALVLASKDKKAFALNPEAYTPGSFNNMKAGWVCAIIGTCLSAIYFIVVLIYIIFLGFAISTMPWHMVK